MNPKPNGNLCLNYLEWEEDTADGLHADGRTSAAPLDDIPAARGGFYQQAPRRGGHVLPQTRLSWVMVRKARSLLS